ncbi:hypothetical protein OAF27_01150 [Verrucomicrobiales bacterium]|nr:hypothetical protein [Verrucomicrobiales bacterium]
MKKRIAIVAAMIVLIMVIGFERIEKGIQFMISDNRTEREITSVESTEDASGDSWDTSFTQSSKNGKGFQPSHSRSTEPSKEMGTGSDYIPGAPPVAVNITGDLSPLHFISASLVTGSPENSASELERLRLTVEILGDGLDSSVVILDADVLSTTEAPFILFARDSFDLTAQAKLIYDRLQAEDSISTNTTVFE